MINKFVEGLVFGGGFTLSFTALGTLAAYFFVPMLLSSLLEHPLLKYSSVVDSDASSSSTQHVKASTEAEIQFHELPLEERLRRSSAIALANMSAHLMAK